MMQNILFKKKECQLVELFRNCSTQEEKYKKIIDLGKRHPSFPEEQKIPSHLVEGCQSTMYLYSFWQDDGIQFRACSDALISAGLAFLLTSVYSGESPETILKTPPEYLDEIGVSSAITPNRANGLYSIHLKMKQDALKLFMNRSSTQ